ncbi:MAG: methyltransferase domain-containing protein [Verrucomicrobiota bacterium]
MEIAYYSEYAQVQRTHWWYIARAEILEAILRQHLPAGRDHKLLDLGCGPGGMRPMLAQFGKLVSTDFTFDALQFCQAQQLDHLVAADAMRLPFASGIFEAACVFDVIEHLPDDARAARELYRVLKPGGKAFVTVPAFQFLWGRQDIVSHHHRRYTAPMLRRLLADAGFELRKLSYFNTLLFPPIAAVRLLYRVLGLHQARPGQSQKSDFTVPHCGVMNLLPQRIFAVEKSLLRRMNLPFGVSLVTVAYKP